jgi:hypothetical protein
MPKIPRCPHCRKPIAGLEMTPSQAKVVAAAEAAAERRQYREAEKDLRKWYAADFQLIFDAVTYAKLAQAKSEKRVSPILFDAILDTHKSRLIELEDQIKEEAVNK